MTAPVPAAVPDDGRAEGPHAGRVALVLGGTGAIGRYVVRELAAAGAAVAVHTRRRAGSAHRRAADLPRGLPVVADLTAPGGVEAAVGEVAAALGPVDLLVNAVHPAPLHPAPVGETGDDLLGAHLDGVGVHLRLCRQVLPGMRARGYGRIVYVSGALMARPAPGFGAFAAAKAAASTLTRYLALEEGQHGITANVVAPGRVAEPDGPEPDDPVLRATSEAMRARSAFGRFPTAAEVAAVVVGLTLPHSDAVTGQTVWVTGGEPVG